MQSIYHWLFPNRHWLAIYIISSCFQLCSTPMDLETQWTILNLTDIPLLFTCFSLSLSLEMYTDTCLWVHTKIGNIYKKIVFLETFMSLLIIYFMENTDHDKYIQWCIAKILITHQVNNNGHLTWDRPWQNWIPYRFPAYGERDIIAPLWTDIDIRARGTISYQQYINGSVLQQATTDINQYFPGNNFTASWVFVATWDRVPYFPNSNVGH